MLQILDFFTEAKVAKSSDIARNMLPSITMLTYGGHPINSGNYSAFCKAYTLA